MPYYVDPTTGQTFQTNPQQIPGYSQQPSTYPDWWPNTNRPQSQSQPQRPMVLPGRFVQAETDITPNLVPQDGSIAVFPLNDLSAVYLKQWTSNGTIVPVKYVPEVQTQGPTPEQQFQNDIQQRLTNMENMLNTLTALWQPKEEKEETK